LFHRLNVIRLRLPALRERREDVAALTRFFLAKSAKELGVEAKRITDGALERLMGFDFPGNVRQLENICHWLTVMAPAQVIEPKDLPPELTSGEVARPAAAELAAPAVAAAPAATPAYVGGLVAASPFPAAGLVPGAGMPVPGGLASAAVSGVSGGAVLGLASQGWLVDLQREARRLLESGDPEVWDTLTRQFEGQLIHTALEITRGRRIEAAHKLGIGRNTITRKIQELGLDD
jgi:two-component system nitrogen regulation response regulator GlnG